MSKKKMVKINMSWGGHIYIEPYQSEDNEEENRSKIYDKLGEYLDYISTESITKEEYNSILASYQKSTDIQDFIENKLFVDSWDYGTDLNNLLYSIYEDTDNDTFKQLEKDIATLNDEQLMSEYYINKIGKWYFYLNY